MRDILENARLMDRAVFQAKCELIKKSTRINDDRKLEIYVYDVSDAARAAVYSALDVLAASDAAGETKTSGEVVGSPETVSADDGA